MKKNYKIGIHSEHSRSIGRRFCEGLARFLQTHPKWEPIFFESESVVGASVSGIDGFIWAIPDEQVARILVATGKPVVDNGSDGIYAGTLGVGSDHVACGEIAAEHFLSRRFAHFAFCGWHGLRFSDLRGQAFKTAIMRRGFVCSVYECRGLTMRRYVRDNIKTEQFDLPSDAVPLMKWLKGIPKPAAVFCANDLRAWQLQAVCSMADVRVPEEIAILGADNDTVACSLARVQLSSVDTDGEGLGWIAAESLDSILEGRRSRKDLTPITLHPKGVEARASTAVFPVEPPWLSEALIYIRNNVEKRLIASDVAAQVGMSYVSVEKAFRKNINTTIQKEIMASRLEVAQHVLATTQCSLKETAKLSGFGSTQYLCLCFQKAYGCSPLA